MKKRRNFKGIFQIQTMTYFAECEAQVFTSRFPIECTGFILCKDPDFQFHILCAAESSAYMQKTLLLQSPKASFLFVFLKRSYTRFQLGWHVRAPQPHQKTQADFI